MDQLFPVGTIPCKQRDNTVTFLTSYAHSMAGSNLYSTHRFKARFSKYSMTEMTPWPIMSSENVLSFQTCQDNIAASETQPHANEGSQTAHTSNRSSMSPFCSNVLGAVISNCISCVDERINSRNASKRRAQQQGHTSPLKSGVELEFLMGVDRFLIEFVPPSSNLK